RVRTSVSQRPASSRKLVTPITNGSAPAAVKPGRYIRLTPLTFAFHSLTLPADRWRRARHGDETAEADPRLPEVLHRTARVRPHARGDPPTLRAWIARHGAQAPAGPGAEGFHPPADAPEPRARGGGARRGRA